MRIGVAGITGRLGRLCAEEVRARNLTLSGGTSRTENVAEKIFSEPGRLAACSDVIIDVSRHALIPDHARDLIRHQCAWVVGKTGMDAAEEAVIADAAKHIPVLRAANFSPGLNLLLDVARQLSAALPADDYDVDVTDIHHRQKIDAPSGTAKAVGAAIASGRGVRLEDVARYDPSGARQTGQIGFAELRAGQIVGEHSVIFTSGDEQITIGHRAFDRRVFARGAVNAALWLHNQSAGLFNMADIYK